MAPSDILSETDNKEASKLDSETDEAKSQDNSVKFEFHGENKNNSKPDRNELALDRTILANERTYQAWLRTGMAGFGAGLGIVKFMKGFMPPLIIIIIVNLLILFSAAAFLQAAWRYSHLHVHTEHLTVDAMPVWKVKVFSIVLALCSILALAGLLISTMQ